MYNNEEKAIKFVIKVFEGQKRIKEDIDMSFHSITVGFMLKSIGCSEEVVVSGFLHDIIEDTSYDYEYIKDNFGKKIADNVLILSEDITIKDFYKRKEVFIEKILQSNEDILLIELADKLHNLLSDYDLWKEKGTYALKTLDTTYEMNKWFYLKIKEIFNNRLKENVLLKRYNDITKLYFENWYWLSVFFIINFKYI